MRKENYTPKPKILILSNDRVVKLLPFHNGLFDMITNDTCPTEYFEGDLCYNADTKQIVGAGRNQWISICQIKSEMIPIESNVLFCESFEMMELRIINVQVSDKKIKAPKGLHIIDTAKKALKKKLKAKVKLEMQNIK